MLYFDFLRSRRARAGPRARPQPRRHPHARGLARLFGGALAAPRAGGRGAGRPGRLWEPVDLERSLESTTPLSTPGSPARQLRRCACGWRGEKRRARWETACSLVGGGGPRRGGSIRARGRSWPSSTSTSGDFGHARALVDDALGLAEGAACRRASARRSPTVRARLTGACWRAADAGGARPMPDGLAKACRTRR